MLVYAPLCEENEGRGSVPRYIEYMKIWSISMWVFLSSQFPLNNVVCELSVVDSPKL